MNDNGTLKIEKVTQIESKQQQPLMKYKIRAIVNGFPVTIKGEGRADMELVTKRLIKIGACAPTTAQPEPTKTNGAPLCPAHGTPMKASRKPGSYFCPRRGDDGDYCPHKS